MNRLLLGLVAFAGCWVQGHTAYADDGKDLMSRYGVIASVGGGVEGFTSKTMRDTTSPAGLWDVRIEAGSQLPVSIEAAYVGTAATVDALRGTGSGTLVGSTVEGDVRANVISDSPLRPYAFLGVGWRRYDVTQVDFTVADAGMNDHDNVIEFPMGAGVDYRYGALRADVRFTVRAVTDNNLVLNSVNAAANNYAPMHTWGATARVGFEF